MDLIHPSFFLTAHLVQGQRVTAVIERTGRRKGGEEGRIGGEDRRENRRGGRKEERIGGEGMRGGKEKGK